ncbi:hypothetical protein KJ678_01560, partial [Patescibacteria group bacterium]|nr:hypothetical protein [Patescibacteria group bacterium]
MENQTNNGDQNTQQIGQNSINQPLSIGEKPKTNFALVATVVLFCFFIFGIGGYYLGRQSIQYSTKEEESKTSPTPVITGTESPINWKTYQNENVTFKFPSSWVEKPILIRGSGYTQEFEDPKNKFSFTFLSTGNYSQVTGKPYADIDEYVNMPYKVKTVVVGGQEGRQPLPRAGSENINSVMFFSKDSKTIYTLELKTGNTALDTSESDVNEGQRLFNQIIETFRFINNSNDSITVKLYYHDSKLDPNIDFCNANNYIEKEIPKTNTPIKDAINALIRSDLI